MSMIDRAAQFSPFAALTGYDAAIRETARLTDARMELNEDELDHLNLKYQLLLRHLDEDTPVQITYFQPDSRKAGGAYRTISAPVKKIDIFERMIHMKNGMILPMDDIFDICFEPLV